MSKLAQDVRFGARMLRKNPGFTLVAVVALAFGIASSTAIFSLVDQVLLRPLPYPQPEQILEVTQSECSTGAWKADASPANYLDWVALNHVFSEMAAARGWQANLTGGDRPERIRSSMTTASFFPLFGIPPLLGRALTRADETPGSAHVAVLSYALWQRRYTPIHPSSAATSCSMASLTPSSASCRNVLALTITASSGCLRRGRSHSIPSGQTKIRGPSVITII